MLIYQCCTINSEKITYYNSSVEMQYVDKPVVTRQHDLHSIVLDNQYSGADHDGVLPRPHFLNANIPVRQYGKGKDGVSRGIPRTAKTRSGLQANPWTQSARSKVENEGSVQANVPAANVKHSGQNYHAAQSKWNENL